MLLRRQGIQSRVGTRASNLVACHPSCPFCLFSTDVHAFAPHDCSDLVVDVDITFDHYASSATLRWTSNLDMQDDFWGVNDVRVSLVQEA